MHNSEFEIIFDSAKNEIDWTIDSVIKRGIDDFDEDFDDYSELLQKHEFRRTVVFELYENYFPPKRHEFELQIINDIVEAIAKFYSAGFTTEVILGGVLGNAAFALLARILAYVISKFKAKNRSRNAIFSDIEIIVIKLDKYFKEHECATNKALEVAMGVDRDKLEPLLKLGGFICYRRKNEKLWVRPK